MGFPDTASLCTSGASCGIREVSLSRTRIIPEMTFTCSGTATHWRAAGEFRDRGMAITNSVLSIWRERSSESDTYDRVGEIELGICDKEDPAPSVMGMSNVYECTLPQSESVSVQSGDIVGIELPSENQAKFRLYFDNSSSGPTNYVFNGHGLMFSLNQRSSTTQDQPQISLTVVGTPSSTTEPLSTDALTTQPTSISTEATSMAATGPAPTEASTMAMTTETQASTKAMGMTEVPDRSIQQPAEGPNFGLIIGSVIGGVVGIILLSAVVILSLVLVYQSRKYKRESVPKDSIAMTQNVKINDELDTIEVRDNLSYIPGFRQISTESNVAYGEAVNDDSNHLYESIDPPIEEGTTQLAHSEQNGEDIEYY